MVTQEEGDDNDNFDVGAMRFGSLGNNNNDDERD
jgi:hypothetical protein